MNEKIKNWIQVNIILFFIILWHITWIKGFLAGKGFISNLNMIWGVFFFFLPLVVLYLFISYIWKIRKEFKKHLIHISIIVVIAVIPCIFSNQLVIFIMKLFK